MGVSLILSALLVSATIAAAAPQQDDAAAVAASIRSLGYELKEVDTNGVGIGSVWTISSGGHSATLVFYPKGVGYAGPGGPGFSPPSLLEILKTYYVDKYIDRARIAAWQVKTGSCRIGPGVDGTVWVGTYLHGSDRADWGVALDNFWKTMRLAEGRLSAACQWSSDKPKKAFVLPSSSSVVDLSRGDFEALQKQWGWEDAQVPNLRLGTGGNIVSGETIYWAWSDSGTEILFMPARKLDNEVNPPSSLNFKISTTEVGVSTFASTFDISKPVRAGDLRRHVEVLAKWLHTQKS
jgi:hypothetical protein